MLAEHSFDDIDIAFFSAGGSISKKFAPFATQAGAIVVDNSSAFRMDDGVPLVVPEINGADVKANRGIIANPNCTTAVTLMALYPLHRIFHALRIFAATYQAVSGSGARAIAEPGVARDAQDIASMNLVDEAAVARLAADRAVKPAIIFGDAIG